jgi:hypothetical protein
VKCGAEHPLGMRCTRERHDEGDHRNGDVAWSAGKIGSDRTIAFMLEERLRAAGGGS